jgi:hypothetical protein
LLLSGYEGNKGGNTLNTVVVRSSSLCDSERTMEEQGLKLIEAMKNCLLKLENSGAIEPGDIVTASLKEALRKRISELEYQDLYTTE